MLSAIDWIIMRRLLRFVLGIGVVLKRSVAHEHGLFLGRDVPFQPGSPDWPSFRLIWVRRKSSAWEPRARSTASRTSHFLLGSAPFRRMVFVGIFMMPLLRLAGSLRARILALAL